MKQIISTELSSTQYHELKNFMKGCITEPLNTVDDHDTEKIMWYKDCEMGDYFTEWTEIYDDSDDKIGEGLDTISSYFILNDDTRADFECAFDEARDEAYTERLESIAEDIKNTDFGKLESIDIDDSITEEQQEMLNDDEELLENLEDEPFTPTCTPADFIAEKIEKAISELEAKGYEMVAHDGTEQYDFYIDFLDELYECDNSLSVKQLAQWAGATVCVLYQCSNDDDYDCYYFKKINN